MVSMGDLFSHPEPAAAGSAQRETSVVVPVAPDRAFAAFTDLIHLWWPLAENSAFGAESHLEFDSRSLVEESLDGEQRLWASIRDWQPPSFLVLDFFFGRGPSAPATLRIDVEAAEGGSKVSLQEHVSGSASEDPSWIAAQLDWAAILQRFGRFMGAA